MINRIRKSKLSKFLMGLMGLYLFNLSVDTTDPYPEYIPEDLSFNDQESIIEIIIEQILGFENAIKEYDDHDTEEHNKKQNTKIELLAFQLHTNENPPKLSERSIIAAGHKTPITDGFIDIDSPPPKIGLFSKR